jgi:hypothetical protein
LGKYNELNNNNEPRRSVHHPYKKCKPQNSKAIKKRIRSYIVAIKKIKGITYQQYKKQVPVTFCKREKPRAGKKQKQVCYDITKILCCY